jgi:hypothetical protein
MIEFRRRMAVPRHGGGIGIAVRSPAIARNAVRRREANEPKPIRQELSLPAASYATSRNHLKYNKKIQKKLIGLCVRPGIGTAACGAVTE